MYKRVEFEQDYKKRWPENLARAGDGMWVEALNFLDSFCFVFLIKEKNESPSGKTKDIKD
ncbi:MAG: hypothetical protein ABFS16_15110 [Bacteroidota bacterium]